MEQRLTRKSALANSEKSQRTGAESFVRYDVPQGRSLTLPARTVDELVETNDKKIEMIQERDLKIDELLKNRKN